MSKIVSFDSVPARDIKENYLYGSAFKDKEVSVYDKFYKCRTIYNAFHSSYARYMDLNRMVSDIYLDSDQAKGKDFQNFVESRLGKEVKRESKRLEKLFDTLGNFPENKEITNLIKDITMKNNELTADIDGLRVNINHVSPAGISLVKLSSRLELYGFIRDASEFRGDVNLSMTIGTIGIEADSIYGRENPNMVYKQEFEYKISESILGINLAVLTVSINHVSEDLGESYVIVQLFDRYGLELLYGNIHKLEDITDKFIPLKGDR